MKSVTVRRSFSTLATVSAIFHICRRTGTFDPWTRMSRRRLLGLGGFSLSALVIGAWKNLPTAVAASNPEEMLASACLLAPEQTEGPYYIAREKVRSNIAENKPGVPFTMRFTVVDARTCKPIKGAAVDIWHCDATGIYSGFGAASAGGAPGGSSGPTDKRTFLRGVQFTDARGQVHFQSVYPGWYRGRTVHVHVKVHLGKTDVGHVVHTGQLYFSDTLTAHVYQSQPYKTRASQRDTFNATDGIYQAGGKQSLFSMQATGHHGYVGSRTLGVHVS